MWSKFSFSIRALSAAFLISLFVAGCSKQSPTGSDASQTVVTLRIIFDNSETSLSKSNSPQKAARVVTVKVTVTAPDISSPITAELPIVGQTASGSIRVPQGNSRTFTVQGLDEADIVQFEGQRTINLTGPTATVDIIPTTIPPVPSQLRVVGEPQHNVVNLAWDKNTDQDFSSYELYRSTSSTRPNQPLKEFDDINMTSHSDSTVEGSRSYTYWLNTVDTEGYEVAEVPQAAANTPPPPTPNPVTMTKVEVSESPLEVVISWTRSDAPKFAFYRIARSEVSPVDFDAEVHFTINDRNTTTFTDNTVEKCKEYYYAVFAVGRVSYGDFPSEVSNEEIADTRFPATDFIYYDGGTAQVFVNAHSFGPGGGKGDLLFVQFTCKEYPSRIDSVQLTFQTDGTPGVFRFEIIPTVETDPILYGSDPVDEPAGATRKNFPVNWGAGEGEATGDFLVGIRYLGDGTQPGLHADTTAQDSSRSFYFRDSTNEVFGFPNGDLHFHIRAHVSTDKCTSGQGQWIAATPVRHTQTQSMLISRSSMPLQTIIPRNDSKLLYSRKLETLRFNGIRRLRFNY